MKTLYLECSMGAAGDMITAALFELIDDKENFLKQMNSIGFDFDDVKVYADSIVKCGVIGTHIRVVIYGIEEISEDATIKNLSNKHTACSHHHNNNLTSLDAVETIITKLNIPQKIKNNATSIYHLIAEAEAYVHGKPVDQIHFHELGGLDAIVDIVGVCMLIETLNPKYIIVSPINVGGGFVNCAHGILPVPTPATTFMLKNIPVYSNNVQSELCTPTGAAILKHFATRFETMPVMRIQKIGYGMGSKDFEVANYIRAFLGETNNDNVNEPNERIVQLQCNLDDMTGEAIGFAVNILLQSGALDVFTTPIQMKKNRPAVLLTCICNKDKSDFFTRLILRHTTTFGVRKTICDRYALDRKTSIHETPYGSIRIKTGEGYSIKKSKPEYNDVAKTAYLNDVTFAEVLNKLRNEEMNIKEKYESLKQYLLGLNNLIVAFSGGVDSTFLLKVVHDVLNDKIIAVTAKSCSFPQRELNETIAFCKKENIRHIICHSEELSIKGFSHNPVNRCYLCKTELFTKIWNIARQNGIEHIVEASNIDDNIDYRPGLLAISEQNIKSPLRYAKLTKNEIRKLSKHLGLSTWNKQSFACLASRFPYGEEITSQRLAMIDCAEQILLNIGLKQVRVRYHHGNIARIETDELGFATLMKYNYIREEIYKQFKIIGFVYVAIDIQGYRTGSMNETLNITR